MIKKLSQVFSILTLLATPAMAEFSAFRTEIMRCTSEVGASGLNFDIRILSNTEVGTLHASGTVLTTLTGLASRIEIYPLTPSNGRGEEGTSTEEYSSWASGFKLSIDSSNINVNGAFATLTYQGEKHAVRCKQPQ